MAIIDNIVLRYFIVISVIFGVCRSSPEETEYETTREFSKKQFTEDRLLPNIVRARNSSRNSQTKDKEDDSVDKNAEKKARTAIRGSSSLESRGSNCCGRRHGPASLSRPDYNKIPSEGARYPPSYGDRNVDRYGWQVPTRPTGLNMDGIRPPSGSYSGIHGGNGDNAGTYVGDRYGQRPGYGGESSNNRPGGPSYGSGGTSGYGYANGGYGGYGGARPGYGIAGTFEDGDEFNPNEPDVPENGAPPHYPGNLQTQKAVALKALAGVALIGAAAALATNPVLLPIGIVSGRRKRSEITSENNDPMDYVLRMITKNFSSQVNGVQRYGNKKIVSPKCVARLTCEIRKDYITDLDENFNEGKNDKYGKIRFNSLIQSNVLDTETIDDSIKELIKMALAVSSEKGDCGVFACNFKHND